MNKDLIYFWVNGEVVAETTEDKPHGYFHDNYPDIYSFDERFFSSHELKYGKHTANGFDEIPFEDFPGDFKMALILMGVL